ncbi:MAG: glycosyltransferase family 39 protein [Candidatus Binataceae bacterium]|nr:glycosyltransferase family 39 protein [Candidatus Binataceae bacterium]
MTRFATPRFAIPLLIALGLALFIVNLGGYPFYTRGEPREAVTVLAMIHGQGWILPLRAGVEIPSKPPLMHWCAALISVAAGVVDEWTVRLPSAIFAIGGLLLAYFYVRLLFDELSALLAGLILAACFQYLQAGTGARVDMTLTFFMELAFFEIIAIAQGLTTRWILLYAAFALAVLAKGPVGVVLPALAALVWIAWERQWSVLKNFRMVRGALIVIAIDGGWYLAAAAERGAAFVHKQILAENLYRVIHSGSFHEGHAHPFYYLELALMAGFLPWTLITPAIVFGLRENRLLRNPRMRYLAIWCIVVILVYSLARSKRGVYLLSIYPALAAIAGIAVATAARQPHIIRWLRPVAVGFGVVFIGAAGGALTGYTMLTRSSGRINHLLISAGWTNPGLLPALIDQSERHGAWVIAMSAGAALMGMALVWWRLREDMIVLATAGAMACLVMLGNLAIVPAIAQATTLRDFASTARQIVADHPAAYLGGLNYDVAFYSERDFPVQVAGGKTPPPQYLFVWREIYTHFPPKARQNYTIALASQPTELDGAGVMILLKRNDPAR